MEKNYISNDINEILKNNICYVNKNLYVKESSLFNIGFGVFTNSKIKKYDIIEIAPVILLERSFIMNNPSEINNYTFKNNNDTSKSIFALGYGGVYNHSDNPNVFYKYLGDRKMIYIALTDINKDEELFVSYGKNWWTIKNRNKINN